ncbi:hypothetical protein CPB84DRAFT_1448174 [Gymnopilus junonius]|uniref:Transmembrane protein n=1 Tax=Gymnopilus junonius TaxID=109634 RepID=A0A9P5NGB3_GYMJU|nr:hypothetical protein CPB84DRAFT_1448174 [Gymnopilus junonius]
MVIDSPSSVSHHHEHGHARCRCTHDDELMYSNSNHEHGGNGHRRCHNARLRRYLLPALAVLLLLCGLMAVSCMQGYGSLEEWGSGAGEGLFSRQVGPGASNGSGSTFTNRKLYLIVIFVGLFLVLVFGVMLAAWCCRGKPTKMSIRRELDPYFHSCLIGSFENPLCCPCYLCACCGGLGKTLSSILAFVRYIKHVLPCSLSGLHRMRFVRGSSGNDVDHKTGAGARGRTYYHSSSSSCI